MFIGMRVVIDDESVIYDGYIGRVVDFKGETAIVRIPFTNEQNDRLTSIPIDSLRCVDPFDPVYSIDIYKGEKGNAKVYTS